MLVQYQDSISKYQNEYLNENVSNIASVALFNHPSYLQHPVTITTKTTSSVATKNHFV